jgi:hypothetical protein
MTHTTPTSGRPAAVFTRTNAFSGHARVEGNWIHFVGRRRVGHGVDGVYWSETVERTWPSREVRVIRWQAGDAEPLAAA